MPTALELLKARTLARAAISAAPAVVQPARVSSSSGDTVFDRLLRRAGKTRQDIANARSPFLLDERSFTMPPASPLSDSTSRQHKVQLQDLSPDQRKAFDQIFDWLTRGRTLPGQLDPSILTLGGYAGVGKTALVALVAQAYTSPVAFAAYTGKAAGVLRKKLNEAGVRPRFCGTIHSLIYQPVEDAETGEVRWAKKSFLGYTDEAGVPQSFSLIVIDEASMVQDHVLAELLAFGTRILAIGDHGQLPPVRGSGRLMHEPNLRLEKIHRQAESNPIIRLSACIRETGKLLRSVEDGDKIRFVERKNMQGEIDRLFKGVTEADLLDRVLLTYTNADRCLYNRAARLAYSREPFGEPRAGDLVICLKNHIAPFVRGVERVYNGLRGFLRGAPAPLNSPHRLSAQIEFADFFDRLGLANTEMSRHQFGYQRTFENYQQLYDFKFKPLTWDEVGTLFDYGYALTVHKFQGSQASDVLVLYDAPGNVGAHDFRRWLYTACTRASERLTVVI